jgi:hypothetical protein
MRLANSGWGSNGLDLRFLDRSILREPRYIPDKVEAVQDVRDLTHWKVEDRDVSYEVL